MNSIINSKINSLASENFSTSSNKNLKPQIETQTVVPVNDDLKQIVKEAEELKTEVAEKVEEIESTVKDLSITLKLYNAFTEVNSYRNSLNEQMDNLQQLRVNLYENLLTAMFVNSYARKSLVDIKDAYTYLTFESVISSLRGTLLEKLDNMLMQLNNRSFSRLTITPYLSYFLDTYNELKVYTPLSETYISASGIENLNDENLDTEFKILIPIGKIASYFLRNSEISDTDAIMIRNDINSIRTLLRTTSKLLKSKKESCMNRISEHMQMISDFNIHMISEDENYDSTYTTNILTRADSVASYMLMLSEASSIVNEIDIYENMRDYINLLNEESSSVISGCCESLNILNQGIDNFKIYHELENDYGEKLVKICESFGTCMIKKFKLDGFLLYEDWEDRVTVNIADGQTTLSQLYILQKIGALFLEGTNESLNMLLGNIFLSIIRRNSLYDDSGSIVKLEEVSNEKDLLGYKIYVSENARYESLAFYIKDIDSSFRTLDKIDLSPVLNINDDNEIDNLEIDSFKRIEKIFSMTILNYIFKDSSAVSIESRIATLSSKFIYNKISFRTLLFKYFFEKLVNRIIAIAEENNTILDNVSLDSYVNKFYETKDLLLKYISVFKFKKELRKNGINAILYKLREEGLTGISKFLTFLVFDGDEIKFNNFKSIVSNKTDMSTFNKFVEDFAEIIGG